MQAYPHIGSFRARRYPAVSVDDHIQALLPDPYANSPCLETPYSQYLKTNYAACGQEILAVAEIVNERQAQLRKVDADIACVESIMKHVHGVHQQLLDKRDQIVASMEVHQGLVSCIRRLPSEILSEIFVQCLPLETHIEPDTRSAPLLLLRICKGWRRVALKTPQLWCSLSVQPSDRVEQCSLFAYHNWLSRAKECPLSLAVDARRPLRNPEWQFEVTELLQPYVSRAARLHVIFDEATAPALLLKDVPMLEHLKLEGDLRAAPNIAIVQPEPRLHSLKLEDVVFSVDVLSGFDPGWTHLTRLQVTLGLAQREEGYGPLVLDLLELCPRLQDLYFAPAYVSRHDVAALPEGTLVHAHLRRLRVWVLHGAGSLLDALTLPRLRQLAVWDMDIIPSAWWHNEFKTFLARSRCPLETLKIHGDHVSIKKEDRAEYAALIPTLKHLDLCLDVMMHG